MTSKFIPPNGNPPMRRGERFALPGIALAPPAIKTPINFKFLDRVRVRLQRSALLELQNSAWAKFYAGATGRIIRFNIEDGTLVVVLDTENILNETDRVMESFEEQDLERINANGDVIDIDGHLVREETAPGEQSAPAIDSTFVEPVLHNPDPDAGRPGIPEI